MQYNQNNPKSAINLQGIMAGNPSTDGLTDSSYYVTFLAQHALVSLADYEDAQIKCNDNFLNQSASCRAAIQKIFSLMGTRIK